MFITKFKNAPSTMHQIEFSESSKKRPPNFTSYNKLDNERTNSHVKAKNSKFNPINFFNLKLI